MICNTNFYADNFLKTGDIVGLTNDPLKVDRIDRTNKKPVGISHNNVVKLKKPNLGYIDTVGVGNKIVISVAGKICAKFNRKLKLPIYQPIYIDRDNACFTWRNIGPHVGQTSTSQDQDGFVIIEYDFRKVS